MAWVSFRASLVGFAPPLTAIMIAAFLSGCTPPERAPQGVVAPPPPPAPVAQPEAPIADVPTPEQTIIAGRTKVALLAPLTGPNRSVGQAMLDAANMALFDVSADLALLPRDSGSTTNDTSAAAQKAVADGAGLILGPVFAYSVRPVREAAQITQINVITYSTDANAGGGNVFVMGFLPAQQVDRVIGFAKSRGKAKLAALVPDNPYGAAVTAEIGVISTKLGLPPARILTVGRDPKAQLTTLADDPPDMLLVALGGDQLQNMAPALGEYATAHPVQLLGTGLWDDPALSQVPALAGAWYAAPAPENFTNFAARFQQIYNYRPPRIATLAYDSVALAASVAKTTSSNLTPFSRDVLVQPNGFVGIDGGFRFLPNGLSQRNLAVLQVGPGGPNVVDPAPPTFETLGE